HLPDLPVDGARPAVSGRGGARSHPSPDCRESRLSAGDCHRIGLHGCEYVHRERAQLHGEVDRGRGGSADAIVLRVHSALLVARLDSRVRAGDFGILRVRGRSSTFTVYREISSVHSKEFWKCGSARELWNSWKRIRSIWKGNPLRVAAARVLPCSARWSRSSQTATGRGRDATTEEPRDRDSGARAQGARPADRESLGQHRRGGEGEAPPAARAPRSGPPARLQDEAPSRPAAEDGLGA